MVEILVNLEVDQIVADLCTQLDHDDLLELIKQIDAEVADYDFTKELRDYFVEEVEDEDDLYSDED